MVHTSISSLCWLIMVLILSDCFTIRTMTVQSAFYRGTEAVSAEIFEYLLRELNGAHLRLSFYVVCLHFQAVTLLV